MSLAKTYEPSLRLSFSNVDSYNQLVTELLNYQYDHKLLPLVVTPNVDQFIRINQKQNREIKKIILNSAFTIPDGMPLVWLSKIKNGNLTTRLTGSDLFPILWNQIKLRNKKALFVVANEFIATKLQKEYRNCICIVAPLLSINDLNTFDQFSNEINKKIESFSPEFVFLGLGFPKQEILFKNIFNKITPESITPLFLALGASYEFYLGLQPRAPKWVQSIGFEWLFRIKQEPKRLIKRYLYSNSRFLLYTIKRLLKS